MTSRATGKRRDKSIAFGYIKTVCNYFLRPSDLFAVFIQLMSELSSFLVRTLGLEEVSGDEVEGKELLPSIVIPLSGLVLLPLLFLLGAANAVFEWLKLTGQEPRYKIPHTWGRAKSTWRNDR